VHGAAGRTASLFGSSIRADRILEGDARLHTTVDSTSALGRARRMSRARSGTRISTLHENLDKSSMQPTGKDGTPNVSLQSPDVVDIR
jgi:hypothetical protein